MSNLVNPSRMENNDIIEYNHNLCKDHLDMFRSHHHNDYKDLAPAHKDSNKDIHYTSPQYISHTCCPGHSDRHNRLDRTAT